MFATSRWFCVVMTAVAAICLFDSNANAYGGGHWLSKVKVCKVPHGDLTKAHEIRVPKKVAKWILKKHPGSSLGPCPDPCSSNDGCDDGDVCTQDICNPDGTCDNTQPVECDDGNPCTTGVCVSDGGAGCTYPEVEDGAPCDDESLCTANDQCTAGQCGGDAISDCCTSDADCGGDACDPQVCSVGNQCLSAVKPECGADACFVAVCDPTDSDGDGEVCGETPVDCDDGDICTDDSCVANACMTPSGSFDTCEHVLNPNNGADNEVLGETCNDGLDNDCDGVTDADDDDCLVVTCPCKTQSPDLWATLAAEFDGVCGQLRVSTDPSCTTIFCGIQDSRDTPPGHQRHDCVALGRRRFVLP